MSYTASVTSIDDRAFSKCKNLGKVVIPGCVTSIGSFAFADYSNLKTVDFADDISEIDIKKSAFSGSQNVKLIIPASLRGKFENIFGKDMIEVK